MASNRVIGRDGALPWHLPEDLKFFRKTTTGHPILMGRKTWESLGSPLPNRRNLILSRTLPDQPGAEVLRHPDELAALGLVGPVYIIGGAEIYQLLLPQTDEILLTVLTGPAEGDTTFPAFEQDFQMAQVLDELPGRAEWRRYVRRGD
jgi:dihydrofolate reductase